jgi:sulfonate transport system substrate-binding protein
MTKVSPPAARHAAKPKGRLAALLGLTLLAACHKAPPARPVLHVGDQLQTIATALKAAGEDHPKDYDIDWANFLGGPAVTAAETGGSVDVGWMNETPLIFAQAAGSPVKVVAAGHIPRADGGLVGLVVAPRSPIRDVAGLKGHKVSYAPGTSAQFLLASVLAKQGLSFDDIVSIKGVSLSSVNLDNGTVDAQVASEPWLSSWIAQGKARLLVRGGPPNTTGFFDYIVASDRALADPAKAALIGDFATRVARAFRWVREHPKQAAPLYAKSLNIPEPLAEQILTRAQHRFDPIDNSIVSQHQQEADLFLAQGQIAHRLDATKLFDHRYDGLIAPVEADVKTDKTKAGS